MDFGKYIAHRGLHSELVPENSLTAFRLAVEKCLSIELDVRLTKDCRIVVFHDNDLMRMCGIEGKVFDYTYEQLSAFKLKNSDEKIPLLSEVLKIVDGKVPLLIELKGGAPFGELESRVDHMMKKYKGEFAVQSFNPFSVMWFRFHSPKVTRGQLSSQLSEKSKSSGNCSAITVFENCEAVSISSLPLPVHVSKSASISTA